MPARRRSRSGLVAGRRKADSREDHWLAVTVYCSPDRLHELPEPLEVLRHDVELRIRPATGDKGTELLARPIGDVSREDLRRALRRAKSLIETGTVLPADPPATHPRPAGRVLRLVTNRADGGSRAATPSTCACRSPTTPPSPSRTAWTT